MFELHRSFLLIVIKASGLCGKDKSGESFRDCQNNAAVVIVSKNIMLLCYFVVWTYLDFSETLID